MLPGGWSIPYRQIKTFREKKPFYVFDDDNKKVYIENSAEVIEGFNYYYGIWDDWHVFKVLPEGKGTNAEPIWLLDFLKYYKRIYQEIEVYRQKRNN